MAVVAGNEGAVVVEQGGEQGLGDGDVPVVEQHHSDVFYGNGALGTLFPGGGYRVVFLDLGQAQHQLPVLEAQVGRVSKVEGLLYHTSSISPMAEMRTLWGFFVYKARILCIRINFPIC